jgi:predicted RNase H-like HicB family nuclease
VKMKYAIVIEKGEPNFSAYVPDLPGCVTTGRTVEEIKANMREAIELHIEGMKEDGEIIPQPTALELVDVEVDIDMPVKTR